ncbi:MAG: alanyl-tRNA editing protein [Alphaproteobacteria bacterium]|nr:alanyl-tRNA editing protein [Alphaproteobacteria bacterium]
MPTELVFRADPYAKSCPATVTSVEPRGVVLDRTVFYPTGGGQPGDQGLLRLADGTTLRVVDAVKGEGPDSVVHVLEPGASAPAPGTPVTAELDWERRHRHMRMHTCLHLLSAVLPYPVTGGQVAADKGRLDFDIPEATLEKEAVTEKVNALIAADHAVTTRWITDAELAQQPELVKTMAVKPPTGHGRVRLIEVAGLDLQPCGGTHVARTGEIGRVEVTKIEKKGRINRRVVIGFADNKL